MSNNLVIKNDSFIQSMHNDIQCLSLDNATRHCDRCWFTSKQIQDWAGMNKDTLNRKLEKLARVGRIIGLKEDNTTDNIIDIDNNDLTNGRNTEEISSGSNLSLMNYTTNSDIRCIKLPDERGTLHYSKIYNLNVLNHLAMVELDNEKLNTIANKFSDILSEVETTGQYNVQKQDPSYVIEDPIERAKAWIREQEEKRALEAEKKALEDKTKELEDENETLTQELTDVSEQRDKAIQTKQQISDSKTAKALGRVGGLVTANNRLKDELYLNRNYRTIGAIAQLNGISENSLNWRLLKSYCNEHGLEVMKIQGVRFQINVYPIEAFRAIYPELRVD